MKKLQWFMMMLMVLFVMHGAMAQDGSFPNDKSIMLTSSVNNGMDQDKKDRILLTTLLSTLEKHFDVTFLYKDEMLVNKHVPKDYLRISKKGGEKLSLILEQLGITYQRIDRQTYVLLDNKWSMQAAQIQEDISGAVTDAQSGETLPGVNVMVKGTTLGTSTDSEGDFKLTVESLQDTLIFSFVGYQTQEVPMNGRTEIFVVLQPQAIAGEELVVVGYGTQKKATLTGSISRVSGKDIAKAPVSNISNTIGGQIPGVISTTDSGEPGADESTLRIRGNSTLNNNNPLVVIDGVPNRSGGLNHINPNDIEDITVLKDATAAIYGSQAANGVILVSTKRGTRNQKPQFQLNLNQGFNQPTRIPEMTDAKTYLTMLNEVDHYRGREVSYSQEEIEKYGAPSSDPWLYPNTDWFNEALDTWASQTRADLAVNGGGENINYHLSLGGLTEDSFFKNGSTQFNKYNFRSNIDAIISENIDLQFDVNGRFEDRNYPTQDNASANFRMLMRGKPQTHAFWPNGLPGPDIENGINPVVSSTAATGYDDDDRYYLQSNLSLNFQIPGVEGLEIRGRATYDKDFRSRKLWQTPWTLYTWDRSGYENNDGDPEEYLQASQRGYNEPRLRQRSEEGDDILINLITEYQQDFVDHSLGILAGAERQTFTNSFHEGFRRNFSTDRIDELVAGGEEERQVQGNSSHGARLTFFTRLNYDYQSKYILELVGRYDGSYIFPEDRRYGFFPAFSVGWRLTEEQFFRNNVSFFNDLKLRASWGQTGNDRIDPYQYLTTYTFGSGYVIEGSEQPSISQSRIANPNVTWEVANQFDIGIEGAILDNQLSFEIDYYDYLRTDILTYRNASIPQSAGLELPRENIGKVSSWGYDGSMNWQRDINSNSYYNINLNISYATNRIDYWDEPPGAPEWQKSTGAKMNTDLYYKAIGIFEDEQEVEEYPSWADARPGDIIFEDKNGDGVITAADRVRIDKNNIPEWMGGITLSGGYNQFDFSVFFQGAAGANQYIRTQSGDYGNYLQSFAEKRWTPENPTAKGPRAFNRQDEYWMSNDNTYFLRDTDYIRLKQVEIGYSLSPGLVSKLGIRSLRIYASGFNLVTWDTFNVMDPEASHEGGLFYPQKRVINSGLDITF